MEMPAMWMSTSIKLCLDAFTCDIDMDTLGNFLHAALADLLAGHIAGKRCYALDIQSRKCCDHCYYIVRDLDSPDIRYCANLFLLCHIKPPYH